MTVPRIALLRQMIAQDPQDGTAHYMLGHEYFKAQNYAEAVAALRAYLALAEDEGAAYRMLAQSLARLGQADAARQAYQEGLAAARRHHHQPLIEEYTQALADLG
ncbi:MAG: tetratricopeptide repeat protein [candidate division NC10 bacterium]|nr:tetratricopeptide repeat protein [candidate division NC10 bacterium]